MVPTADESSFDSHQGHQITLYPEASTPAPVRSQSPIQLIPGHPSLRLKRRKREAKHLTPPNVEVKNACYN